MITKRQDGRVVITGLGAVTPLGTGVDKYWEKVVEGKSGVDYISQFDTSGYPAKIAAEVQDFDPLDYMDRRTAKR